MLILINIIINIKDLFILNRSEDKISASFNI